MSVPEFNPSLHPRNRQGRFAVGMRVRVKDSAWAEAKGRDAKQGTTEKGVDGKPGTMYVGKPGDGAYLPPAREGVVTAAKDGKLSVRFGNQERVGLDPSALEPAPKTRKTTTAKPSGVSPEPKRGTPEYEKAREQHSAMNIDRYGKVDIGGELAPMIDSFKHTGPGGDKAMPVEVRAALNAIKPGQTANVAGIPVTRQKDGNWDVDGDKNLMSPWVAMQSLKDAREQKKETGSSRVGRKVQEAMSSPRWVERDGERILLEADGSCKMPHKAMSKRGMKKCKACGKDISDLESTAEDKGESGEEGEKKSGFVPGKKGVNPFAKKGKKKVEEAEVEESGAFTEAELEEAADSMAKATSPKPFSKSKTSNWVARAGGLPPYVQHVAHALVKDGKSESNAIQMAIGIIKNWAHGKGKVDSQTRAAATLALSQWTAMKAKSHASGG